MIMLVADVFALSACAMWVGLTTRNPNRTTGITLRRILVLPWVVAIASFLLIAAISNSAQRDNHIWELFLAIYLTTGIAADLFFGLGAWRRLHAEFREVAVQRFTPSPSIWSRLRGAPAPATGEAPPVIAS
jgi:hypothetical protein